MAIYNDHLETTVCKQIFDWLKFLSRYRIGQKKSSLSCENSIYTVGSVFLVKPNERVLQVSYSKIPLLLLNDRWSALV